MVALINWAIEKISGKNYHVIQRDNSALFLIQGKFRNHDYTNHVVKIIKTLNLSGSRTVHYP